MFGGKKTPHELYAAKIEDDPADKQWIDLSKQVLASPQAIKLPYRMTGYFPAGKPRALAFRFSAKRGELVYFDLGNVHQSSVVFADVFRSNGSDTTHLMAAEPGVTQFDFIAEETGTYLLRIQPGIENAVSYTLSVASGPSLGFPVAGNKARVGSVWGDSRANGKRSHEGIDIFAARRTPVIAAADGYISSVKDGGLGGKTVNLKLSERNISLYYAHLDKQLVRQGQYVNKGDTIGLVGNTGNARTTPPHLHFGIYTYGGAIDPLPFVQLANTQFPVPASKESGIQLQLIRNLKTKSNQTIKPDTPLVALAVTSEYYIAELPGGEVMTIPLSSARVIKKDKAEDI